MSSQVTTIAAGQTAATVTSPDGDTLTMECLAGAYDVEVRGTLARMAGKPAVNVNARTLDSAAVCEWQMAGITRRFGLAANLVTTEAWVRSWS